MKALKRTTMTGAESSICEAETAYMSNPPSDYTYLQHRSHNPSPTEEQPLHLTVTTMSKKQKTHFIC